MTPTRPRPRSRSFSRTRTSRRTSTILACLTALIIVITPHIQAQQPPPPWSIDSRLSLSDHELHSSLHAALDTTLDTHWHFITSLLDERYDFDQISPGLPHSLQAAAMKFGLEYRVENEPAFTLETQPGWYGDSSLKNAIFDSPITVRGAFPIHGESWFGVLGVYYSRLSSYPWLPIAGVVNVINKQWELDLTFPEATLYYMPNEATTWTAFVDLIGYGYRLPSSQLVEYYETKAGLSYEHDLTQHWTAAAKAGVKLERTFDYFEENRTVILDPAPFIEVGLTLKW